MDNTDPRLQQLIQAIGDPAQRKVMAEKLAEMMDAPPSVPSQETQGASPQQDVFQGLQ
jgi:hypothetical protein